MLRRNNPQSLSAQIKKKVETPSRKIEQPQYDGDFGTVISTGSTLLDLAISGGRVRGGGIPGGILVEAFGPSGSGKTVLLSEIAGAIQRQGGEIQFYDPEARLNKQFAKIFDLDTDDMGYARPKTVTQIFESIREWEPGASKKKTIHGVFADSLAALSTDMEMEKKEGDKMGMRRAKEFSEELRKTCRMIAESNLLMVCSNQVRVNVDAGAYGQKYTTPGGEAVGFYSSLRLRFSNTEKIKGPKIKIGKKEVQRVIGVRTIIEVHKNSVWKPHRSAPLTILFDYGIDDIRENIQFLKDYSTKNTYTLNGQSIGQSMEDAIKYVEKEGMEEALRQEVILKWNDIERKFDSVRKPKR